MNRKIFCSHRGVKCFWLRIFGRGLFFTKEKALFSERHGHVKFVKLGFDWRVTYLEKWRL